MDNIKGIFKNYLGDNMIFMYEIKDDEKWKQLYKEFSYVPVEYTITSLKYQLEYVKSFYPSVVDLSMIYIINKKPVGMMPLVGINKQDGIQIFSQPGPFIYPPLFSEKLSTKIKRKIIDKIVDSFNKIYTEYGITCKLSYSLHNALLNDIGYEWYRKIRDYSNIISNHTYLYLDLSNSEDDIHQIIRKSYRSLINKAYTLWKPIIYTKVPHSIFAEYRMLHRCVAGRTTRSKSTWDLQEDAINKGNAFLIILYNQNNKMVGGGFFEISKDEGNYSVGVYDRSLFKDPVSHLVQWEAIKYMKKLQLKWYKIGRRYYNTDDPFPTSKEVDISYFKEGFASNMSLNVILELK